MTAASRFPGVTLKYCFERIGFTQLPYKLEFARRAGSQVVRWICVIVPSLTRSVSFCGSINWNLAASPN